MCFHLYLKKKENSSQKIRKEEIVLQQNQSDNEITPRA
jgi:hypothetical protein